MKRFNGILVGKKIMCRTEGITNKNFNHLLLGVWYTHIGAHTQWLCLLLPRIHAWSRVTINSSDDSSTSVCSLRWVHFFRTFSLPFFFLCSDFRCSPHTGCRDTHVKKADRKKGLDYNYKKFRYRRFIYIGANPSFGRSPSSRLGLTCFLEIWQFCLFFLFFFFYLTLLVHYVPKKRYAWKETT